MKNNKLGFIIFFLSSIISAIAYNYLPEKVASHWNIQGQADAYSGKLGNLLAFPLLILFMQFLLTYIPKLDPKYKNIIEFEGEYTKLINTFLIFFLVIQLQLITWNLGVKIPMNMIMPVLLGLLFYVIGDLMFKTKSNWSIGIKTPWTLSSEKVWEKTHVMAGNLFKLSLPLFILSSFIPNYSFVIVISYILGITIYTIVYSYIEYKKEVKG